MPRGSRSAGRPRSSRLRPWKIAFDVLQYVALTIGHPEETDHLQTTKKIYTRGDTLNAPTITMECSSPLPDVLQLEAYHWKAQKSSLQGPHYEVFPDIDPKHVVSTVIHSSNRVIN